MDEQYQEQMSKLSKEEQQQVKEDAKSWKKLGGYEAIQEAIESGETSEQEIRDRNERMSERAHETITKVEQPIERGLTIPTSDVDEFMERFVEGEDAEVPDEGGHGSSGFSIDAQKARFFSKFENENETKTSIIIRLLPNSKGEVRGLFIDGEPGTEFEEGEIIRSSKSKAKVVSVEKVKYPGGKLVITITLQEPDDLSEVVFKEEKEKEDILSKKYLEGPLNPKGRKKTVSRKSAVQKAAKKYARSVSERISIVEDLDLIVEGGAYGHMNHPFDDKNLTFGDLKKIITDGLGGNLNREDGVTEKLDGQNLMISWKDGKLVTARNKGQLKNFGEKAMTTKGVASKFAGRGDIKNAFVFAMKDLSKSVGALSDAQKEKIFGNGKKWMNLEVMPL
jgi:hypothetical protein